ncbi:hypothetical protein VTL71DRAFT_726 [Oculimacula yallundae]|uniref:Uncharacterized protein n=1 Tax=Oculimacula yallundae TaxID=86028 RepID=A0ABR4D0U8_9HELO
MHLHIPYFAYPSICPMRPCNILYMQDFPNAIIRIQTAAIPIQVLFNTPIHYANPVFSSQYASGIQPINRSRPDAS